MLLSRRVEWQKCLMRRNKHDKGEKYHFILQSFGYTIFNWSQIENLIEKKAKFLVFENDRF